MGTCIAFVVTAPDVITTITLMEHTARVIWTHLPAITTGLRAASAALSLVAGIRALIHRHDHPPARHQTDSDHRP
jgi:hypothetical protein